MKKIIYISFFIVFLSACHTHKHDDIQAGHVHNTKLQFWSYNEDYELFLEADPLAVGKKSKITVYLTKLPDFKPVKEGVVTASIIVGNKGIRQKIDTPSSEGIYIFNLEPGVSGDARLLFKIQTEEKESQIKIDNIKIYDDAHEAEHIAEETFIENPNAITFPKKQSWKIDFKTDKPAFLPFGQVIKTTARIQSSQEDEVIVTSRTNGIVNFSSNLVVEGKNINAGQELFTISGSGLLENNFDIRYSEIQNNFIKAEANYKRSVDLVKEKIISEKDFLDIKSEYETTKIAFDDLIKNFNKQGQKISGPMNGYVKKIYVNNGEYVEAGQALVSISQNKSLLLIADVQSKYATSLPYINDANLRILNTQKVYSLKDVNGKLVSFGKTLNEDNFMLPVTFQVDNKSEFIPGSFLEIYIKTRQGDSVIAVPNTALTEEQGVFFVYVQLTPESFEKREVVPGMSDGIYTEIKEGLDLSDRIVTKGAVSVKLAQASGALDPHAGHVH